jgi:hypothetical protein
MSYGTLCSRSFNSLEAGRKAAARDFGGKPVYFVLVRYSTFAPPSS